MKSPLNRATAIRSLLMLCGAATLSACAPLAAGVRGHDGFILESKPVFLQGTQTADAAAQCFERNASFLPLSEFSRDSATGTFTYRLRVAGVWYEQVLITPDGSGSRAELRLSPGLDTKWRTDFDRDRGTVAARCLSATANGS